MRNTDFVVLYTGQIAACEFHVTVSRETHMKQISREIHVNFTRNSCEFHVKIISEIHMK